MYDTFFINLVVYGALGAIMGVAGAITWGLRAGRYRAVEAAWKPYAAERSYQYWQGASTGPTIDAERAGVRVQLSCVELDPAGLLNPLGDAGLRQRPYTMAAAKCTNEVFGGMIVVNRALAAAPKQVVGYRDVDLSDQGFAETFLVYANMTGLAERVLDANVRRALMALARRPFVLVFQDGAAWLRWPDWELDPAVLDAAVEASVAVAHAAR